MNSAGLIAVAREEIEADVLLKNAKIVNTFVGNIEEGYVAIYGDRIAGIGNYQKAKKIIDLKGKYLAPGLINGHTHIESSMLHPAQYAQAVVPHGTTAVVTDLHEITNVAGFEGMKFVMEWAELLPMDMFFMVPSCVPATHMETSGAEITDRDVARALEWPNVLGLGEMMNFPGVINGDEKVLNKISAAHNKIIDGHSPGISDKELNAYIAAGIYSDHETTAIQEGREKLKRGIYLMIREGSSEKNLDELLPLVTDKTYKRCLLVVDDRNCSDLLRDGDIDAVVRKAIQSGLDPVRAIQLATINAADYFRLYDRGGIAPGYIANLITLNDLHKFEINMVFYKGQLVAKEGKFLTAVSRKYTKKLTDTVHMKSFSQDALKLRHEADCMPVIEIVPGQIITKKRIEKINKQDGIVIPDVKEDILKLVVIERHKATGNIGLGLIKGFGLKRGALASSIAHDSHNIIAVGTNDEDIYTAIQRIKGLQGGLVVCADGKILAELPLPIAGLLSFDPLKTVVNKHDAVEKAAASLGDIPQAPFAILSFLALPVIPELKLTDLGLVDVLAFKIIS
jgi:adenine deaminase